VTQANCDDRCSLTSVVSSTSEPVRGLPIQPMVPTAPHPPSTRRARCGGTSASRWTDTERVRVPMATAGARAHVRRARTGRRAMVGPTVAPGHVLAPLALPLASANQRRYVDRPEDDG
jgi:hypothetical protein